MMTPTTELTVQGLRGATELPAIVDTGFDGYVCLPTSLAVGVGVCLPTSLAVGVGLELAGENEIALADGTRKMELVFTGVVGFLGKQRVVPIYLTDSDDALVGTSLLSECRLAIDFTTGEVQLTRKEPRKKRRRK